MTQNLDRYRSTAAQINFDQIIASVPELLRSATASKHHRIPLQQHLDALLRIDERDKRCLPSDTFVVDLSNHFHIDGHVASIWKSATSSVFQVYRNLGMVVNVARSPHVAAYESAVATLYREELDRRGSANAAYSSVDIAMICARRRVGAPFPRGEARFKIEALLITLDLRLRLAEVANAFSTALRVTIPPPEVDYKGHTLARQKVWMADRFTILGTFLLKSCRRDADVACSLSADAEAHRLALRSELKSLAANFAFGRQIATVRVAFQHPRADIAGMLDVERDLAAQRITQQFSEISDKTVNNPTFRKWALEEIIPVAEGYLQDWADLSQAVRTGTVYLPVTAREKMEVAKAVVDASHGGTAGRFYQCPNGHSYTVADCGQTMVESECPECGAPIGGRNHNLRADNARDMEMERLAMEGGAQMNPHADL